MPIQARPYRSWFNPRPVRRDTANDLFEEPPSEKLAWMRLGQVSNFPLTGLPLVGNDPAVYQELRSYLRQARTYWDAARVTAGSAAALLYYYAALNLAKAELLTYRPSAVTKIYHGIGRVAGGSTSIRDDLVKVQEGVFPLLYEKRTGKKLKIGFTMRVSDLLSLIPELSHEVTQVCRTRIPSARVYAAVVSDSEQSWSLIGMRTDDNPDYMQESLYRRLAQTHEEVEFLQMNQWKDVLGLTKRFGSEDFVVWQSKKTFSFTELDGSKTADPESAIYELPELLKDEMSAPITVPASYLLTPSVTQSDPFVLPLNLVRYASMFYLSSVVRYAPGLLDPNAEGPQAWLMDSFVVECQLPLLIGMVDELTQRMSLYNASYLV